MSRLVVYLVAVLVVFGVNLLPAFGPPTWAVLVYFRLHDHLAVVTLVLFGAAAAASGRLLLALAFAHLRDRVSDRQRDNLQAAGALLTRDRKRTGAGVLLFALSPVPSAQLFEAAGLIDAPLRPLTMAFFAGRLVSYTTYVAGASAASRTDLGRILLENLTSPWAIAIECALLAAVFALTRVDWKARLARGTG